MFLDMENADNKENEGGMKSRECSSAKSKKSTSNKQNAFTDVFCQFKIPEITASEADLPLSKMTENNSQSVSVQEELISLNDTGRLQS